MLCILAIYFLSVFLHRTFSCPEFCGCSNMEIHCSDRGLLSIPQAHGWHSSAKHLSLAGNFISSVVPSDFTSYPGLKSLDLQNNSIGSLPHGLFNALNDLKELRMGNNRIASLVSQSFSGLTKLRSLDLHENRLHKVHKGAFAGLLNLTKLRLSGNALCVLPGGLFAGLKSLEVLHLDNNQITSLSRTTFEGLRNLCELDLSRNNLSIFPASVFSPLTSLAYLRLNNNFIRAAVPAQLKPFMEIQTLALSNNVLSQAYPFKGLIKLSVLKLNRNLISQLEKPMFSLWAYITELDLSGNLISMLDESVFEDLTYLRLLNLSNNKLSHLSPRVFRSNVQLSFIELQGNPWSCDCRLLSLKRWLASPTNRNLAAIVKCAKPENLKGKHLDSLGAEMIQKTDVACSDSTLFDNSGESSSTTMRAVERHGLDSGGSHTHSGADGIVSVAVANIVHKRDVVMLPWRQQQGPPTLSSEYRATAMMQRRTPNSTGVPQTKVVTADDACTYNQLIINNVSAGTVTPSTAQIRWSLAKTGMQDVYFRVMYDQFDATTRFSRFVNVKQGTVCDLRDLRPSTPYFVCVEGVVNERVCHVAPRDLCLGIVTKDERPSGPDPQTVLLYFAGANTVTIAVVLVLLVGAFVARRRRPADTVSLMYSQNTRDSCAVCVGLPLSDRVSGIHTNSSQTGTYQPNDIDAIDLPPAH